MNTVTESGEMKRLTYSIVTPAYNEADFIPQVISSMAQQTHRPEQWVIVDDRSSDNTWDIIQNAAKEHHFIVPVQVQGDRERRVGANVVHVFEQGRAVLNKNVDILVKMDADVLLDPDYFDKIQAYFQKDPVLGMASGKTYIQRNGAWVLERIPDTHVSGACKAYRMACFDDMDGLLPLLGWDILDGAKARMKGWRTASFRDMPLYHLRLSGSARGMLRARMRTGRAMYTIRAHPLFVLGKSVFRALEKPYLTGLIIPFGYAWCFITRPERLADDELAAYLRSEQIGRIMGRTAKKEEWLPRKLTKLRP